MQALEILEKFAQAGRIAFREDEIAPVAVLVAPGGAAEVSLYGAHVLSWRPTGQPPALWLAGSYRSVEPGAPIRGGIPVCWPWFGRASDPALPMHGCVRTEVWSFAGAECDAETTVATFALEETPTTLAIWPHRFRLELKVTVGKTLDVSLATTNTGDAPFSITEALHTYFRVRDIADTLVTGFDCQPYMDKAVGGSDGIQNGAIAFAGETDRVYFRHSGAAVVSDNGAGRRVLVAKRGSGASVVWNPWIGKCARLGDMKPDDWRRFVCVETANAGGKPIEVAPGASHAIGATFTAALEAPSSPR